jgi:hypothetical protein
MLQRSGSSTTFSRWALTNADEKRVSEYSSKTSSAWKDPTNSLPT